VRVILDTSVLLSACCSKSGISRAILDIAAKQGWKLIASPWVRDEVEKNLSKFPFESTAIWVGFCRGKAGTGFRIPIGLYQLSTVVDAPMAVIFTEVVWEGSFLSRHSLSNIQHGKAEWG
jgi:hypothetical protein